MIFDTSIQTNFYVEPHLSDGSPFRLFPYNNIDFPLHLQYSFELMFVMTGEIALLVNGNRTIMHSDDVAIIPPGVIHGYESIGPSKGIILIFPGYEFPELQALFAKHKFQDRVFRLPDSGIVELLDEQMASGVFNLMKLNIKGFVNTLFYGVLKSATLIPRVHDASESVVIKALLHIGREYDVEVNLEETARHVGVTSSHLSRSFKKVVGCNFNEYVINIRIDKSKWLLRDKTMPIYNVASECGFGCLRNFDRAFKRLTNKTPTQYRNELAGN